MKTSTPMNGVQKRVELHNPIIHSTITQQGLVGDFTSGRLEAVRKHYLFALKDNTDNIQGILIK